MLHFCKFNLEFIGLAYDFYEPNILVYGISYFELYKCRKCGKLKRLEMAYGSINDLDILKIKIKMLKDIGYLSIKELIDNAKLKDLQNTQLY